MFTKNSILNYALSIAFILCTIIPLGFIDNETISRSEKRKLNPYPQFSFNYKEISTFPPKFESYWNDHFGFRAIFLKLHNTFKFKLGVSPVKKVLIGEGGWLFYATERDGAPIKDYIGSNLFDEKELLRWKTYLETKHAWLKSLGIEYVFVIAPNKHTIYSEYLPSYVKKMSGITRYDQLILQMKDSPVQVIDLRQSLLLNKKKQPLYYDKHGTHWNHLGASLAQYKIAQTLATFYPEITPIRYKEEGFKIHTKRADTGLFSMMNVFGKADNTTQSFIKKLPTCTKIIKDLTEYGLRKRSIGLLKVTCSSPQSLRNALVFRDSFFTKLEPFISQYFQQATYIWARVDFSWLDRNLSQFSPDIVIEERAERYLGRIPRLPASDHSAYQFIPK